MLSLASVSEFPTFTNYKISITLLYISKCLGKAFGQSTAKLCIFLKIHKTSERSLSLLPDGWQNKLAPSVQAASAYRTVVFRYLLNQNGTEHRAEPT